MHPKNIFDSQHYITGMGLHRVKDGKDSTTILFYLKEKENFTIVYLHEGSGLWSYPQGEELQPRIL
jgi:hypothetical protein